MEIVETVADFTFWAPTSLQMVTAAVKFKTMNSKLAPWKKNYDKPRQHMEKEMAAHSSILAWRILWMEEPGGLLSIGFHRVRRN